MIQLLNIIEIMIESLKKNDNDFFKKIHMYQNFEIITMLLRKNDNN